MIVWILPVLVLAGAGIYLWGRLLPKSRHWSRDVLIEAPAEEVWEAMTDYLRQIDWRSDLRSVETGTGPDGVEWWREKPLIGPANWFRIVCCRQGRVLEVERLPNGFCAGRWCATLERAAQSTRVMLSETMVIEKPLARVLANLWLHGGVNADAYPRDLKRYVESRRL